jgi:chromosome partitioning protein
MRRIAVINQKGGVGKTTTSANLGAALARQGRRVVLIDMDAQANLSISLGVELASDQPSTYTVLLGESTIAETLRPTATANLSLIASNIDLSGAELELAGAIGREHLMRDALSQWESEHRKAHGRAPADYVIFDCPPSLGLLSINALAAAGEVLITLQTEFLALQGMSKLVDVVQLLRRRLNPELVITGILPCLYDSRLKLAREVLGEIRRYFGPQVFPNPVRSSVKLAEAPSFGQSIFEYAPVSKGAEDYRLLAREVMKREGRDADLAGLPAFNDASLARTNVPAAADSTVLAQREVQVVRVEYTAAPIDAPTASAVNGFGKNIEADARESALAPSRRKGKPNPARKVPADDVERAAVRIDTPATSLVNGVDKAIAPGGIPRSPAASPPSAEARPRGQKPTTRVVHPREKNSSTSGNGATASASTGERDSASRPVADSAQRAEKSTPTSELLRPTAPPTEKEKRAPQRAIRETRKPAPEAVETPARKSATATAEIPADRATTAAKKTARKSLPPAAEEPTRTTAPSIAQAPTRKSTPHATEDLPRKSAQPVEEIRPQRARTAEETRSQRTQVVEEIRPPRAQAVKEARPRHAQTVEETRSRSAAQTAAAPSKVERAERVDRASVIKDDGLLSATRSAAANSDEGRGKGANARRTEERPLAAIAPRNARAPSAPMAPYDTRDALRRIVRAEDLPPLPPDAFEILTSYVRDE